MVEFRFVAFLDVLGFSEMVQADFESAGENQNLRNLEEALGAVEPKGEGVQALQFSDSIVLSSSFDPSVSSLQVIVNASKSLQLRLFQSGILIRGGIAHGRHYHAGSFLFSQALIDAYRLEAISARFPRVVISRETISLIGNSLQNTLVDYDDLQFVDFLEGATSEEVQNGFTACTRSLAASSSVEEKRDWLARYTSFKFSGAAIKPKKMRRAV